MDKFITSLRIFISSAWLSYCGLFTWTQPQAYIALKVFYPLTQLLFFVYLGVYATGKDTLDFYIVGNAIQVLALNGVFGVTEVVGMERNLGTLIYLFGSPANRLTVFLGRALFNILDGIFTVILCFIWGVFLGLDLSRTDFLGLFLTILITAFSICAFGLLLGSLSLLSANIRFLANTIYFLLLILSGSNLPPDKLPLWVSGLGAVLPLTRGIQSARRLVGGAHLDAVWSLLAGELVIGIIYFIFGILLFHWIEIQAKRHATFEAV